MTTTPHDFGKPDKDLARRAKGDFVDFLNDEKPPMFVADSLAHLLRTRPPVHIDPAEIVELISAWSDDRANEVSEPVSAVMLTVLRRILDAHRLGILPAFDPQAFYRVVGAGLADRCPPGEVAAFRTGLRDLQGIAAPPGEPAPAPSDAASEVVVQGTPMSVGAAQEAAISRIEHEAYMTDADFDGAYRDLDASLATRLGLPIHGALSRITRAAVSVFNTGRVNQALRLFGLVQESFERLAISAAGRNEVQWSVTEADFNESMLGKVLNDPAQRASAAALVHVVGSLHPGDALVALGVEARRDRRRMLLNAIEAYGPEAYPVLLDHLTASVSTKQPWYLTRNLLFLLSRFDPPDDASRKRSVESVGRYVTHDLPQIRAAAISALKRIGGKEALPYAVRVVDPTAYAPGSIDDSDLLKRHLAVAMELLVETGNDAAIAIVAEIATGTRGGEFDLGAGLRDEACATLSHRTSPLPRRAALIVATALGNMVNKKFKLVTGKLSFGVDPHLCRQLSQLIQDSKEPEAREVLANPVLERMLNQPHH